MLRLSWMCFWLTIGLGVAGALWILPKPLPVLVLLLCAAGFARWLVTTRGTSWREAVLADAGAEARAPASAGAREGGWLLAGLVLLATAIVLLEWRQPYYFTQDDALVSELPGTLLGCRAVWDGVWPNYNPYSCMGAPLANLGLYSLTYPPTYLAYAIARHLLADECALFEVFAVLHLAVGYVIVVGLGRQLHVSRAVSVIVAVSVILSGSTLIMGRCWPTFVPLVVWLPVLAWGLVRLSQGEVGWPWTLAMGSAIGMTFHVGFPQLSIWVTGFFVVGVLVLAVAKVPRARAFHAIPALLVGVGIALPIALPQVEAARGLGPRGVIGGGLPWPDAWLCMVVPYPLGKAPHPNGWGTFDIQYMGQMYFFGGLLGLLFFANVLTLFCGRWRSYQWREQFWCFAALLTLLLMQGDSGGLWAALKYVPVVGRVANHPFRLLPFFVLFASLAGGQVLERTLRRIPRRPAWELLLGGLVGSLLLYHVWMARPSFYSYSFTPNTVLPEEMATILGLPDNPTGRLMAWTPVRSTNPACRFSLMNALPAACNVPAFQGYDPVVENTLPHAAAANWFEESPLRVARAYGLRWHLTVRGLGPVRAVSNDLYTMEGRPPYEKAYKVLQPLALPHVFELGPVLLTELDNVDPLAFVENHADRPLPLRMHAGGIDVDAGAAAGQTALINFLWRPEMLAFVDGASVPCEHDDLLRMRVPIPAGGRQLQIRYAPNWTRGLLFGCSSILGAVVVTLRLRRLPADL